MDFRRFQILLKQKLVIMNPENRQLTNKVVIVR